MAGIYRISTDQPGGVHHHILTGTAQFTVGQQGTGTMDPYADAYEAFIPGHRMEAYGIGLPNGLSAPTSQLNNLGTAHKRFTVFTAPMVPYASAGNGSLDRFINSTTYDTQHHVTAAAIVAAGFGDDSAIRGGHEANGAPGRPGHYPWSVGFTDPFTGLPITTAQYRAAAAKMEGIYRAESYTGFFEWNIGTGDTGAALPSAIMPTHGDPTRTLLGWDWYSRIGYHASKQTGVTAAFLQDKAQDEMYMAYCRDNGILQAHSEYGQDTRTDSIFACNDTDLWYPPFYDHLADNADVKAYVLHYQVNQFPSPNTGVLQEHHLVATSVGSAGGSPSGVKATAKWTGDWPPGLTGPGDVNGRAPTIGEMGSIQSSSNTGLFWKWNDDPNKLLGVASWRGSFGDIGAANGKGTDGLTITITPPVVPPTHATISGGRKVRRQYATFR